MIFFIDVQGTLIDDKDRLPIEGSIEFIDALNRKNIPYILITNNTKQSSIEFLKYLNKIGFNIDIDHYIDPLMVLKYILTEKDIAAFGVDKFLKNLKDLGYMLDFNNPKAVLVSVKKDYSFDEFAMMIDFLLNGAKLYGMHQTAIYAKDDKRYPGVGAILEMLKFATKKDYEIIGKPSFNFFNMALKKVKNLIKKDIDFKDIAIISDDVIGDLIGAKKLGMRTVFVLSGKFKNEDEILPNLKDSEMPDHICKNIGEAAKELGVI